MMFPGLMMFPGDTLPIPVGSAALLSITHSLLHPASPHVIPLYGALFERSSIIIIIIIIIIGRV
jgi:hypothetical protein